MAATTVEQAKALLMRSYIVDLDCDGCQSMDEWVFEAKRHLKALVADVEALRAASAWVPVGERMPEKYRRVLMLAEGVRWRGGIALFHEIGEWCGDAWRDQEHDERSVAFWMPLPPSPEQEPTL